MKEFVCPVEHYCPLRANRRIRNSSAETRRTVESEVLLFPAKARFRPGPAVGLPFVTKPATGRVRALARCGKSRHLEGGKRLEPTGNVFASRTKTRRRDLGSARAAVPNPRGRVKSVLEGRSFCQMPFPLIRPLISYTYM